MGEASSVCTIRRGSAALLVTGWWNGGGLLLGYVHSCLSVVLSVCKTLIICRICSAIEFQILHLQLAQSLSCVDLLAHSEFDNFGKCIMNVPVNILQR